MKKEKLLGHEEFYMKISICGWISENANATKARRQHALTSVTLYNIFMNAALRVTNVSQKLGHA